MPARPCPMVAPALVAALLLAGCGRGDEPAKVRHETDPAITAAIFDPIMVDPGLSGQDRNAAVITAEGSARVALPLVDRGPDAIALAVRDATRLAGGTIAPAPAASPGPSHDAETAGQFAAVSGIAGAACVRGVTYSARWAALLPAALAVYPRGAVQEAAGTDQPGCGLRIVNFLTPVEPRAVADFYAARAGKAGYGVKHTHDGDIHVLAGRRAAAAYVVQARARDDGLTQVDLVTSGG